MSDVSIQWEDPPEPTPQFGRRPALPQSEFGRALRESPGKWARLPHRYASAGAARAAAGRYRTLYPDYEFRAGVADGHRVWARYEGRF